MVALYKDPSGEMVFNTQQASAGSSEPANATGTLTQKCSQLGEHSPAYVAGLEMRIRELELKIVQVSKVTCNKKLMLYVIVTLSPPSPHHHPEESMHT